MEKEYNGERFLPEECTGEIEIEHYQRYLFAKYLVSGKEVLDVACGEGYGSNLLSGTASKVIGMDIDKAVIEKADIKYGNNKLSYITGSVAELPFEEDTFDVIVSFETIEHIKSELQEKFLKEAHRVLKKDGVLIISTPNKSVYTDLVKGENSFHVKEFYVQEFIQFLNKSFKNIELFCQYPSTGYFIVHENENIITESKCVNPEKSRYIIAVCSNNILKCDIDIEKLIMFDDSMYYFLNLQAHELENTIKREREETNAFESKQEKDLEELKEYIKHLENDLKEQKNYIELLEKKSLESKIGKIIKHNKY